jgi:DNA-binding PucR family transcriptional regulator
VDQLADVPAQQSVVEEVLQVLQRSGTDVCSATPEDVHARILLTEVQRVLEDRPELRTGPVHQLAALDAEHGTAYVPTLAAFLAHLGQVRPAAAQVRVHPNTFRYRLRRIVELTGLSLDDPDERLASTLQLRFLLGSRPGAR